MPRHIDIVISGGRFVLSYAELLAKGITPEIAARKPRFNTTIDTNHPTFVFGHLAIYPARALDRLGVPSPSVVTPPGFEDRFKAGVECTDDPSGTAYPAWPVVRDAFFTLTRAMLDVLPTVPDAKLLEPTPDPKARERFPTLGMLASFYTLGHAMMHLGQVSAWRRCFALPSAM